MGKCFGLRWRGDIVGLHSKCLSNASLGILLGSDEVLPVDTKDRQAQLGYVSVNEELSYIIQIISDIPKSWGGEVSDQWRHFAPFFPNRVEELEGRGEVYYLGLQLHTLV